MSAVIYLHRWRERGIFRAPRAIQINPARSIAIMTSYDPDTLAKIDALKAQLARARFSPEAEALECFTDEVKTGIPIFNPDGTIAAYRSRKNHEGSRDT